MEQMLNTTLKLCVLLVALLSMLEWTVKPQETLLDAESTTLELLLNQLPMLIRTVFTLDQLEEQCVELCVTPTAPSLLMLVAELTASTLTLQPAMTPARLSVLPVPPLMLKEELFNAEPTTPLSLLKVLPTLTLTVLTLLPLVLEFVEWNVMIIVMLSPMLVLEQMPNILIKPLV